MGSRHIGLLFFQLPFGDFGSAGLSVQVIPDQPQERRNHGDAYQGQNTLQQLLPVVGSNQSDQLHIILHHCIGWRGGRAGELGYAPLHQLKRGQGGAGELGYAPLHWLERGAGRGRVLVRIAVIYPDL